MNAITLQAQDGAFTPTPTTLPDPAAGPGEVLVRVRAVSLNYRDLTIAGGRSGVEGLAGRVPASDGAGEVEEVGEGVTRFRVGDRVAGTFFVGWADGPFDLAYHGAARGGTAPGMLAEYVVLPEQGAVPVPSHLSFEEASTLPCAAVTAWQALVERGRLNAGQTVLLLGTGGVSVFALQIAVAYGAKVVVTSSSDAKLARARELGAAETVNYRTTPDWEKEVWRITDKRGADQVVEVGGGGTLIKSLNATAAGGHIALIGVLTGFGGPGESLFPLMARNATLSGIYVGSRAHFEALNGFLEEKQIRPVIDRVFPLADAAGAYAHLASATHFGKVVVGLD